MRAAERAQARRDKGLPPWGSKKRALLMIAPAGFQESSVGCASSHRQRKRLVCKTAPADIWGRAPQPAPADARERASELAPAGTHARAASPSDKFDVGGDPCFAGGDPDEESLWAAIDEDMRRERDAWLRQQEQLVAAKEEALEARENELEHRERQLTARERLLVP